jgi:SAM-dependent methyltransferase
VSTDPRQFVLLVIALLVPVVLHLLRKPRALLAWVGITLFVQVFDTAIFTNLPAPRIVGILYLPVALLTIREWARLAPARVWLVNFLYMVVLGVLFALVWRWPDLPAYTRFPLTVQGRALIYTLRTLADLGLTVYIFRALSQSAGTFETLRAAMVHGTVLTAAAGIVQAATGFDPYLAMTALRPYLDGRPRGLSYEPRGLGLACVFGLVFILARPRRTRLDWLFAAILSAALVFSGSTTAFAACIVALLVLAVLGPWRNRAAIAGVVALIVATAGVIALTAPKAAERSVTAVADRVGGRGTPEANVPRNRLEALALRLDVFDASVARFLIDKPLYALTGCGPSLATFPASAYVPKGVYATIWPKGFYTPPSHGGLLELANTGVVGVIAWVLQAALIVFAIHKARLGEWLRVFLAGAAIYLVQTGISPYWAMLLGIGWAAFVTRRPCVSCGGVALSRGTVPHATRFAGQPIDSPEATLYACSDCHLQFKRPRPTDAERHALYTSAPHDHWSADVPRGDLPAVRDALVRALPANASVLDVGCFDGAFLATLPFEKFGVEINPATARVAADRGVTVYERIPERRFDAAIAIDVIEHVDDPRAFLRELAKVADVIVISTGSSHAWTSRLMGARSWYVANPEHISFINPDWCSGAGLEIVSITRIAHEVRPLAFCAKQAMANFLYLLAPGLVRRLRDGASDPPSWITARDHFVVVFRNS